MIQSKTARWLHEPLLHFLLLGGLLFLLFQLVGAGETSGGKVVVTVQKIKSLADNFERVWQRPPTSEELESLIQEYIKEEIYYREAVKMGLDQDDPIIRRRLKQKLESVTDGIFASAEPTDQDLEKYLKDHPDQFRIESRFTFSHIYLNPERHKDLNNDIRQLMNQLQTGGGATGTSELGDPFMLGYYFSNSPESNIERTFGDQFLQELKNVDTGKWAGPIESGYGKHLVYVEQKTEGNLPKLSDVRKEVEREWFATNQKQASESFYKELLQKYNIEIEQPVPKAPASSGKQ